MTSTNRVRAVFDGTIPDKTPVCEQAFASSVASEILGYDAYTGSTDIHYFEALSWLRGDTAHDEFVEKLYHDVVALHRKLKLDIFFLPWRMPQRPTKQLDDHRILYGDPDGDNWRVYAYDPHSRTFGLESAAQTNDCPDKVLADIKHTVDNFNGFQHDIQLNPLLLRAVKELGDEFVISGDAFCALPLDAGWLEASVLDPQLLAEWFAIVGQDQARFIRAQANAGIWLINGGGDLAFNSGLAYSPTFFRNAVYPAYHAQFTTCDEVGAKYIFRSDGNIWSITDLLFSNEETPHSAAAFYEIDYHAGMTFNTLRARYPNLVLMGNVPCDLLHSGTPAQVRESALRCLEFGGSRTILASSNSILHGTPSDNVYAMLEAI